MAPHITPQHVPPPADSLERRLHARSTVRVPVELMTPDFEHPTPGVASDVSIGGMLVESTFPAAFGDEIVVRLEVPAARTPLSLRGVVRWSHEGAVGIQFGLLGARETYAITQLMAAAAARASR
jgi:hypothetical protein